MTVAELRTKLATLLASDLGKYSNNQLSIWVYGAAQDPPSASDGLECLIQQMPLNPAQGSSGGQRYKPQHWIVTLKNFKKSSNLVNALRKIETNFVVRQYSYFPFTATVFEQARITIFDPTTINI
ncbi:MAG: hypothetical protein ACKPE1_13070 [Dolichospermum sp.]